MTLRPICEFKNALIFFRVIRFDLLPTFRFFNVSQHNSKHLIENREIAYGLISRVFDHFVSPLIIFLSQRMCYTSNYQSEA